ncbi:hypothetical protein DFP74_5748 [Nocardiopsis sp. Huas11]|uniref:hypothetical protein n=1 Tax=Nocardiopsis sp. Huas11 TaxID=2183912 RepID=UPI000F22FAC3|nr:hypothetical protein [Nocardiopsis sp. Huas11]RKS10002.1 hypothetical protein DFP74_5748 [Nocardiopsis sp. Huas11]
MDRSCKPRWSADEVAQRPEWQRALYDQGLLTPEHRQQGRRHLTGTGLRRTAIGREKDE